MLTTFVKHKRIILIVLAAIWFVAFVLYVIFGNGEDKPTLLVATFICPLILYGFFHLMFKMIKITASQKVINFYLYIFLIGGVWGTVGTMIEFITNFPNGYTFSMGLSMTMIVAILAEAKRNMKQGK